MSLKSTIGFLIAVILLVTACSAPEESALALLEAAIPDDIDSVIDSDIDLSDEYIAARVDVEAAIEQEMVAAITWWDLISDTEQAYWEAEIAKHEQNPNYTPTGTAPPPGVNSEVNELVVRIPGYVVGVDFDPDNFSRASSFLFVPFPGACIHVPPPPVNQTVLAHIGRTISTDPFTPYWLTGRLRIDPGENDLAAFSYVVDGGELELYEVNEESL